MLPERLVLHRVEDGRAVPLWLDASDHPWLRALLEEAERFAGRPEAEWARRIREPMKMPAAARKLGLASYVLLRGRARPAAFRVKPSRLRALVFGARAAGLVRTRADGLAFAARATGLTSAEVEEMLLADLRGERRIRLPDPLPTPSALALEANLALAQGFFARSESVNIDFEGNARALVRRAQLSRLLCVVRASGAAAGGTSIQVSGPLALFRRTGLYGRALAALVPVLPWATRYRATARCRIGGESRLLELRDGDPIPPAASRPFDSALEERFARDFRRAAPGWDVVREPEPVVAGDHLFFPDFALVNRARPGRRVLLEIVGFWTPAYLEEKLARLRAAGLGSRLVIAVDSTLACDRAELPEGARIVPFRRTIDAHAVLALLEESRSHPQSPSAPHLAVGKDETGDRVS